MKNKDKIIDSLMIKFGMEYWNLITDIERGCIALSHDGSGLPFVKLVINGDTRATLHINEIIDLEDNES